jgi:hypothetical protein
MEVGYIRTSRIYPMEVGYIRPNPAPTALEPDCMLDMSDASDMFALGQRYLTWKWCQGSGTRPEAEYV